jgi:HAMP domain-containing protein
MDEAELVDGLERVILGILRDHVPGVARDGAPTAEIGELKAELAAMRDDMAAARKLLTSKERAG